MVPVINMMTKLSPHPYAAILLYHFILTPEAMGQYSEPMRSFQRVRVFR